MKLFSRKSLVAAAASTALFAGMVAAPAQADTNELADDQVVDSQVDEDGDTDGTDGGEGDDAADGEGGTNNGDDAPATDENFSSQLSSGSSNPDGDLDAGEIRDWVAVFTAIIGALSTVFVFMERNF